VRPAIGGRSRWGNHGHAFGGFQHQQARIDDIHAHTGIYLKDPNLSNLDCLKAADWEMTQSRHYGQVRPILEVLQTLEACVAILVCLYEQPLDKPRDITRRLNLARADAARMGIGVS
jgi:hypothetical protein